jgi:S1-C subfamily serine protease
MTRLVHSLLVCTFAWAALAGGASVARTQGPPDPPDVLGELEQYRRALFDHVAPSVVFISRDSGLGSGFFVDDEGLVLTNAHVVGEADSVTVVLHDGTKTEANVVERAAEDVDLALLRIPDHESRPLPLGGFGDVAVGDWAAVIGHGLGGAWTFTTGIVTNIYPSKSDRPIFQTQIPINPGASGGPVLDREGRVVGIVTAKIREADDVNFAIRIDVAREFLDALPGGGGPVLTIHAPADVPIFVDGTMRGKGPTLEVPLDVGGHEVFVVVDGEMRKTNVSFPDTKTVDLTVESDSK